MKYLLYDDDREEGGDDDGDANIKDDRDNNEKLRLKNNFQTKTAETRSPRPPASLKYCAVE